MNFCHKTIAAKQTIVAIGLESVGLCFWMEVSRTSPLSFYVKLASFTQWIILSWTGCRSSAQTG